MGCLRSWGNPGGLAGRARLSEKESPRPYHALKHRDFRRLAAAQLVSLVGTQMQNVAIDWHVWLLTRSPLALGLVGLTRVLPIVFFSLWGGVVADRYDRRRVMLATQSAMAVVAALLATLTFAGRDRVLLLFLLTATTAAANAFDSPSRQALVPRLVPREDLPGALTVLIAVFQAAAICGPALAGLLIAHGGGLLQLGSAPAAGGTHGLALIYLVNAVSFAGVIGALVTMHASGEAEERRLHREPNLVAVKKGLQFVFGTPIMVWTMGLDFFATLFSGSLSLLPIFADRILMTGPIGFGWLRAAPGLGALVGSIATAVRPLPRRQGPVLLWAVAAYGAATVAFGFSRSFALTFAALAAAGLFDTISTVIRQMVRQLNTPDSLRGRMTSVNMIFFMGGPQLGELEAGVVAALFASAATGATVAVVTGGLATLVTAAAVAAATPVIRGYTTPT